MLHLWPDGGRGSRLRKLKRCLAACLASCLLPRRSNWFRSIQVPGKESAHGHSYLGPFLRKALRPVSRTKPITTNTHHTSSLTTLAICRCSGLGPLAQTLTWTFLLTKAAGGNPQQEASLELAPNAGCKVAISFKAPMSTWNQSRHYSHRFSRPLNL